MSGSTARRDQGELRGSRPQTDPRSAKLLAALWRNSSSWLCSAVFHAVLLLVLVLSWVTISAEPEERFLVTRIEGLAMEELEVSTLEDQLADVELQRADALPIGIQDPGVAAWGEVDGGDLDPAVDAGQLSVMTSSAELGALFGRDGKGWATVGEGLGGAEFYGIKATGRRFVFVVDGSKSMGRQNKWPQCKRELLAAVSKLRPTQYFYVYLFCGRTHRMFGERDRAEGMVRASAKNVERLQRWLYDYRLQGGTVPHGAMKEALEKLRPDAVYLLSDGQFTDKGGSEKYMLNFARTKNNAENGETGRRYRVAVHTIAFASRRGEVVLKGISDAFQSTFKYVPGAPGRK